MGRRREEAPRISSPLAGGDTFDLVALATAICERYAAESRDFPIDRPARGLDIATDVALDRVDGAGARELAALLTDTAGFVRSGEFREYSI